MKERVDPFLFGVPVIDLHGENRYSTVMLLDSFIKENIILAKDKIVIVHGKGDGIIKYYVHDYLKRCKDVISFNVNNYNDGETIVYLNIRR